MGPIEAIKDMLLAKKLQKLCQQINLGGTMGGWKTWAGAGIIAVAAGLEYLGCPGCSNLSKGLYEAGVALGLVGLGHKLEKLR